MTANRPSPAVLPKLYVIFADNGNVRCFDTVEAIAKMHSNAIGLPTVEYLPAKVCTWTPYNGLVGAYAACASIHHVGHTDDGEDALPAFCEDCGGRVELPQ